ncbi:predicted protein [Nematostella vectensis]|uniref:Polysaccharide biosynthesis domain-containing protein n=1 Tax=Nematostella vectensis TaxID=45351 RepID=A7T4U3_NEMVE|nr:predicted protein [Nematostella vectensis]|eukprot:XP_001621120.1 hypothetical protein NEMVEDRAFT_v1g222341 [Nematostella vectensis]
MVDLKQLQASLPKVPGAGGLTQEEQIELDWAAKAHHHGEAHMKIISAFDPATLNFTSYDDDIYRQYSRCFKGLKGPTLPYPQGQGGYEGKTLGPRMNPKVFTSA